MGINFAIVLQGQRLLSDVFFEALKTTVAFPAVATRSEERSTGRMIVHPVVAAAAKTVINNDNFPNCPIL